MSVTHLSSKEKVIVAIDTEKIDIAKKYIDTVKESCYAIKLGLQFFFSNGLNGLSFIQSEYNIPIFLDLKVHDIPNTVYESLKVLKEYNLAMLTVHTTGGYEMLCKVADLFSGTKTKILGVTILTSLEKSDLSRIGMLDDISDYVMKLADLSYKCGLEGVVCSGYESSLIKRNFGNNLITVVPGIKIENNKNSYDQKRVMTPKEAINNGADYLVIGRSILNSNNIINVMDNLFI